MSIKDALVYNQECINNLGKMIAKRLKEIDDSIDKYLQEKNNNK